MRHSTQIILDMKMLKKIRMIFAICALILLEIKLVFAICYLTKLEATPLAVIASVLVLLIVLTIYRIKKEN